MALDPSSVGAKGQPTKRSWTSKDALLYAVGVGAGTSELAFTTENTKDTPQRVLPTMAVILGGGGIPMDKAGTFNPALMVHGTEGIELYDEIPAEGEIESVGEITGVWDKGKAGVLEFESTSTLVATGRPLFKVKMSIFCRGAGDFGGERGSSPTFELPGRKADHETSYTTREDQALTYRLSGDRNPLHSDPSFAAMGGFDRPILHGLCSYGFTGRALLHTLCGGDPSRFKAMDGRVSKPGMPGDTLTNSMWVDGQDALFQTKNQDGDIVIDQGKFKVA
jgi:acyl dehydratase